MHDFRFVKRKSGRRWCPKDLEYKPTFSSILQVRRLRDGFNPHPDIDKCWYGWEDVRQEEE